MDFIFILLLTAVICGGIPLLILAYMRGNLEKPKWVLRLLAFCGMILMAIMNFPLDASNGNPLSLILYAFIGYLLRREYTKSKFPTCMLFVFLANCFGLFIKYLILRFVFANDGLTITIINIIVFLIIAQAVILLAYWVTPDAKSQTSTKRKK